MLPLCPRCIVPVTSCFAVWLLLPPVVSLASVACPLPTRPRTSVYRACTPTLSYLYLLIRNMGTAPPGPAVAVPPVSLSLSLSLAVASRTPLLRSGLGPGEVRVDIAMSGAPFLPLANLPSPRGALVEVEAADRRGRLW